MTSAAIALVFGCRKSDTAGAPPAPSASSAPGLRLADGAAPEHCIVHLHGKGGRGAPASIVDGVAHLYPSGNAPGWNGLEWRYFPESGYVEVRDTVSRAVRDAGCKAVLVHGFSNGGAAAGKLFCRGESFGVAVLGFVLDDPVPDRGVEACAPAPDSKVRVYWTGALSIAKDGFRCSSSDWTCEGDTTIGIERYAQALGTQVTPSIHREHRAYDSPPEYTAWR